MISFSHTPHQKPKCSSHTLVERRLLFSDALVVVLSLWQVFLLSFRAGWEMGAVLGLYPNEDAHSRLWWPRLTHKCTRLQNHDTPLTLGSVKWAEGMKELVDTPVQRSHFSWAPSVYLALVMKCKKTRQRDVVHLFNYTLLWEEKGWVWTFDLGKLASRCAVVHFLT